MIYSFTLQAVAIAVGLLLIASHLPGVVAPGWTASLCRAFPRSVPAGLFLTALALAWALWLAVTIDLGEFSNLRTPLTVITLLLGGGMLVFSREFLAVRGLAALLLLGANVLLDAAFLRDEPAKLVLVVLAYAWIVEALVFLFSPYLLRDALAFVSKSEGRFRLFSALGVGAGLLLLALGLFVY
jgi:hypothetical protein